MIAELIESLSPDEFVKVYNKVFAYEIEENGEANIKKLCKRDRLDAIGLISRLEHYSIADKYFQLDNFGYINSFSSIEGYIGELCDYLCDADEKTINSLFRR